MSSTAGAQKEPERPPLTGLRVLDFSWLLPGPFCTMQLADLGADVTKVESPGGDYARDMLPGLYEVANRNKRSIAIDLKAEGASVLVERLVQRTDVVVEGFRPGVAERLGIDYGTLSRMNPSIVYASISGYGAKGPMAQAVGHDVNYLAAAGVLSIPGQWGGEASRCGLPIGDIAAANSAALAIAACVLDSRRTGEGRYLNAAMMPSLIYWAQVRTADHLSSPDRTWPHLNPLNGMYRTKDGRRVTLAVIEPEFFLRFCELAGCTDIPQSDDYKAFMTARDPAAGEALRDRLRDIIAAETEAHWTAVFRDGSVPYAPVLSPEEALAQEQLLENGLDATPPPGLPRGYFPFPVPGLGPGATRPAPAHGEHTREILESIGMPDSAISQLHAEGVVK